MLEFMIGAASFFCGFAVMFAIHRVMFDYYDDEAKQEIYQLKCELTELKTDNYGLRKLLAENQININVEHVHTFATPDDVTNIQFWED